MEANKDHTFKVDVKTKIVVQGITLGEYNMQLASFANSVCQYVLPKEIAHIFR